MVNLSTNPINSLTDLGTYPVHGMGYCTLHRIPRICRNSLHRIPSVAGCFLHSIPSFACCLLNALPEVSTWVGVVDWVIVDIAVAILTKWISQLTLVGILSQKVPALLS